MRTLLFLCDRFFTAEKTRHEDDDIFPPEERRIDIQTRLSFSFVMEEDSLLDSDRIGKNIVEKL